MDGPLIEAGRADPAEPPSAGPPPLIPQRMVDLVRAKDAPPGPAILPAVARARLALQDHPIDFPEAAVGIRLLGDVVLVEVAEIDSAALLMLAEIRKRIAVRLVLIAAEAPAEQRILARTLGADHVLATPLDERELAAVLRNALRLPRAVHAAPRAGEQHHLWRLEAGRGVLVAPNRREVRLSPGEHAVLAPLMEQAGTARSRASLLASMNGASGRERVLDVMISKLRRKVREASGMELPLRSARNAGYVFAGIVAD